MGKIADIQLILGVDSDDKWGPQSQRALDMLKTRSVTEFHGKASSFADPADVRAFARCKAQGKSDQECLKVGDNGIGCFGDDTKEGSGPCCAIAGSKMVERWGSKDAARFKEILVTAGNGSVAVQVKDRLPENSPNGAIIDLNPDAGRALGLEPPFLVPCVWKWISV